MLKEVVIYAAASNEDPAYHIMRKAIAHAPYYRYQIKEYTSEAYIAVISSGSWAWAGSGFSPDLPTKSSTVSE